MNGEKILRQGKRMCSEITSSIFSWNKSGKTWNSYSTQEIRFTLYIIQKQAYMKLVTGDNLREYVWIIHLI